MADLMRIANETQTTTYDLKSGSLYALMGSHTTRPSGDGTIVESMTLAGTLSDASVKFVVNFIDELAEDARLFHDSFLKNDSIWFEAGYNGEVSKRSLIYDIVLRPVHQSIYHGMMLGRGGAFFDLAITRSDTWEATSASSASSASMSTIGGSTALAPIPGDLPARIEKITFTGAPGGAGNDGINRLWAGIRPVGPGSANFKPVWQAEDGTLGATASFTSASGASGCAVSMVTDGTIRDVFRMSVGQALGNNFNHMIGRYLVLARVKLSTSSSVLVYGRYGYLDTLAAMSRPKVITSSLWRFLELGEVSIPPFPLRASAFDTLGTNAVYQFVLNVLAYRDTTVSASATINVDSLVLIPSEHYTYSENSTIQGGGSPTSSIHFTFEDGKQMAVYRHLNDIPQGNLVPEFRNWNYPIEGGTLVVAGERTGSQNEADLLNVSVSYKTRFRNIRE